MRLSNVALQSVALAFAIMYFTSPLLANSMQGNLSVKVTGVKNNKGKLVVHVFRKQDDLFKSKPFRINHSKIYSGGGKVSFKNIPFARYSIMAFHDVNNNNIMDHNFIKLPIEPFGFSNNWNFSLFSGKPTFKKTSITFNKNKIRIQVRVM